MQAGAYVQGHEGSVEATIGLRNLLGNAEHAQLSLDYSSQKSSEYALQLWKPRLFGLPWKVRHRHNGVCIALINCLKMVAFNWEPNFRYWLQRSTFKC